MQRSLTNELYRDGCFIRTLGSGMALGAATLIPTITGDIKYLDRLQIREATYSSEGELSRDDVLELEEIRSHRIDAERVLALNRARFLMAAGLGTILYGLTIPKTPREEKFYRRVDRLKENRPLGKGISLPSPLFYIL